MTIWRMRIACWMPNGADTLRIRNTYSFSSATMFAQTRLNITLQAHRLSCSL